MVSVNTTIRIICFLVVISALLPALPAVPLPTAALAAGEPTPHFSTAGVSHISGRTAELDGAVNTEGLATTYLFEYGPTVAYGLKSKELPVPIPTHPNMDTEVQTP